MENQESKARLHYKQTDSISVFIVNKDSLESGFIDSYGHFLGYV